MKEVCPVIIGVAVGLAVGAGVTVGMGEGEGVALEFGNGVGCIGVGNKLGTGVGDGRGFADIGLDALGTIGFCSPGFIDEQATIKRKNKTIQTEISLRKLITMNYYPLNKKVFIEETKQNACHILVSILNGNV